MFRSGVSELPATFGKIAAAWHPRQPSQHGRRSRIARRVGRQRVERICKRLLGVLDQTNIAAELKRVIAFDESHVVNEVVNRRNARESSGHTPEQNEAKLNVVSGLITLPRERSASQTVSETVDQLFETVHEWPAAKPFG